ncbi:MAG: zinc ribbon domain-containing protein [Deltaproteobacteria bacterium]|nr:zinc ribbon domain-containing protein [Deltaproteobacteria bacterium]
MKKIFNIFLLLIGLGFYLGCGAWGPNEDAVKNTVKANAIKFLDSNGIFFWKWGSPRLSEIWDIAEIIIENNYKQKDPFTGGDLYIYEVKVKLKAKKDFKDAYCDEKINVKKGDSRNMVGTFSFEKYGKEWRYTALNLHGFSFKREDPKELVQESKTLSLTPPQTKPIGKEFLLAIILAVAVLGITSLTILTKIQKRKVTPVKINFCPECGTKVQSDDRFCQECGKGLG